MSSTAQRIQRPRQGKTRVQSRPEKRQIESVASISRSGGLEKDGDALKDIRTQQEYWRFIRTKLDEYWQRFPFGCFTSTQREEARTNVLILIRKLREGIVASKRTDSFALEVFEESLRLTTIFESPVQVTSTLAYLLPNFYLPTTTPLATADRFLSILIALLHRISSFHPSQGAFRDQLRFFPSSVFPRDSAHYIWISSLAIALRSCNYAKVELLTCSTQLLPLLGDTLSTKDCQIVNTSNAAILTLIDALRSKTRLRSWLIIRTAYREMTCSDSTDTADWLRRSLLLQPSITGSSYESPDDWLEEKSKEGHIKAKEGMQGKWVVCKPQ